MIEHLSIQEWRAFDAAHPAPTFFARPAWAISLAQTYGNAEPAPLRIRVPGEPALIVSTMRMHGGVLPWREYRAFPLGGYTCFLTENGTPASQAHCNRAVAELRRFADCTTIIPWPLAARPSAAGAKVHETSVVDLSNGIDAALAGVAGIFRRMAGQAERRGVVCAPSDDPGAVNLYYELLEASAKRWGLDRPAIPKELIASLVRNGGKDVEIWFAHAEGRAIGGGVVFYGKSEFFFWSAAMLAEYGRLRPSNALNFALMRAAADRGMSWYNLGSSEGLPGVAKFKDNLGALEIPYEEIRLERPPFKLFLNVRRALSRRAQAAEGTAI
ncbi:MAG TPA: GNAT family N-acetyltransferase [Candidatus Baltobacteraceae bacterium]|jgi:CelD/BcsL family acetyltransferase involved in cellulose biosynthesis|nr:GNAT family N-acetyltransferase [Candidatus Baltobacteraceae bacterium]